MTRWLVPILRRSVQVVSLGVLVLLPLMALYTHFKESHAIHDLGENNWRNMAVRSIESMVDKNERRQQWVERTQGTIWSARLFGVSLSDPLAGAEAIVSSRSFYQPMLWSLLIPVAVTVAATMAGALVAAFPNTGFMGVPLLVALSGWRGRAGVLPGHTFHRGFLLGAAASGRAFAVHPQRCQRWRTAAARCLLNRPQIRPTARDGNSHQSPPHW